MSATELVSQGEFLLQFGKVAHESSPHDGQVQRNEMLVAADDAEQFELVPEEDLVVTRFELVYEVVDHAEDETIERQT